MKKKMAALIAAMALSLSVLAGCTGNTDPEQTTAASGDAQATTAAVTESGTGDATGNDVPLVYGYGTQFNMKFSPFNAANVNDNHIVEKFVGQVLITNDRAGQLVMKGIEGETRNYNGTDYTYKGLADFDINIDEAANTTTYNIKLRDDVKFSDGVQMTIDDVIFSLYAYCDLGYTGGQPLGSEKIQGLNSWRTQTSDEVYEKYQAIAQAAYAAGYGLTAGTDAFTIEQYNAYYELLDANWKNDVQGIVDLVAASYAGMAAEALGVSEADYGSNEGLKVAGGMLMWGFGDFADGVLTGPYTGNTFDIAGGTYPTVDDYLTEVKALYPTLGDFIDAGEQANAADTLGNTTVQFVSEVGSKDESLAGTSVNSISGIRKINDFECEVVTDGFNATTIYSFGVVVAPLHHYGDRALWKPEEGSYGFPRGDLSIAESKNLEPLGAGPYKYVKYDNKIVYLEANDDFYLGAPKIKTIQLKEGQEADLVAGLATGVIDIADPSVTSERYNEIKGHNSNGELVGDTLNVIEVDYRGYGYIGLSASNINVGGDSASEASRNLRKGLATVMGAYRDLTVDSFYSDTASVINYPISTTSWASPLKTDAGYKVAYSVDVNGNDIYTSSMSADEKYAAASQAALGFFEAAGYTVADGKITAAPEGAKMSYEVFIGGDGNGDHPSFTLLSKAKQALADIGMELIINDVADANIMWNALEAGNAEMWCAAWQATMDPDMYQVYHSDNIVGKGTGDNRYMVTDAKLDSNIMLARSSADQTFRKEIYKECFDIIMDWAVELPVYQRKECTVYSSQRINVDNMTPDVTSMYDWRYEVYNMTMN